MIGLGTSVPKLKGELVARLLESLGPTFVKIGQILSTRPDLFSPDMITQLSRLQDQVKPFDVNLIPELIQESTGRSIEDIFESFDLKPLSSASIAHVHHARLKGGEDVAIKIRRPGIVRKVRGDFRILRLIARIVENIPGIQLVPITGMIEEFAKSIEQQMDFRIEADNNRCFRRNFRNIKHVKIPKLFDELCTDSILTMEYLDGLKKVNELDFSSGEKKEAALAGLHALYRMIFIDGFVHVDMHPANVFFRRGPEFVILDVGLVGRLEGDDLKRFVRFFLGMVTNDGIECARVLYETAAYTTKRFDQERFEAAIIELVNRHSVLSAREFEVRYFVTGLFEIQRRFGVLGSTNFTMIILSLLVYEGIVKQMDPEMDFQGEARRVLPWAMLAAWFSERPIKE